MKTKISNRAFAGLIALIMVIGLAVSAFAALPKNTDNVYDETGSLTTNTINVIKSTNDSLDTNVGVEIAVCIVKSLDNVQINDYTRDLFTSWKLGSGVLIVITTAENSFYAVQSTSIDSVLTNAKLSDILQEYFVPFYDSGDVDMAVRKTVVRLASFLKAELMENEKTATESKDEAKEEKSGSIIGSFFKIVFWTLLILVLAAALFFVAALFNDDAAAIWRKYIFRTEPQQMPREVYDDRLYGSNQGGQRRPNPNQGANRGYNQQNYRPQNQGYNQNQGMNRNPGQQYRGNNAQRPAGALPAADRSRYYNNAGGTQSRTKQYVPQQNRGNARPANNYDRFRQGGARYEDEYYGNSNSNRASRDTSGDTRQFSIRQDQNYR